MNRKRGGRHGFTLIELLVVVAIISLLVSILLPSLRKAKELAKAVVCMTHQRTCATSLSLYSADWTGNIRVYTTEASGHLNLWPPYLSGRLGNSTPYLEPSEVYGCPSNPAYQQDSNSYGKNNYAYGMYIKDTEYGANGWDFAIDTYAGSRPYHLFYRLHKVPSPADIVWLADTTTTRNWGDKAFGRMIARFYCHKSGGWTERVHLAHMNKANVLCFDGHAEAMTQDQLFDCGSNITHIYDQDANPIQPE